MPEAPKYWPGDPVRDRQLPKETGRVEYASGTQVYVRWHSGDHGWIDAADLEWVPGFRPKRGRR
jgi:hypothetical protein